MNVISQKIKNKFLIYQLQIYCVKYIFFCGILLPGRMMLVTEIQIKQVFFSFLFLLNCNSFSGGFLKPPVILDVWNS